MKRIAVLTSGGDAPGMNNLLFVQLFVKPFMKVWKFTESTVAMPAWFEGDIFKFETRDVTNIMSQGGTFFYVRLLPRICKIRRPIEGIEQLKNMASKVSLLSVVTVLITGQCA